MSMRKHIRAIMRGEAEKRGAKPSKWVKNQFDRYQIEKYGVERREINKAKSTRKRSAWKPHIELAVLVFKKKKNN